MSSGSHVRLGVLTRTYGLAGGVRLALDGDPIPTIATPCDARIGYSDTFTQPIRLERSDSRSGEVICYFAGLTDRDKAETVLDRALFVPMESLSYEQPFAHPRLVGYEVRNESGEMLGRIGSIFKTPAHYIWQVESEEREWMMPAIDQFVVDVRHDDRIAIVRPIPGMVAEEPENDES